MAKQKFAEMHIYEERVDRETQQNNPTCLSAEIRRAEPLSLKESVDEEEIDSHEVDGVSSEAVSYSETEDVIVQPVHKRKVSQDRKLAS
jgi:hypothetical protein